MLLLLFIITSPFWLVYLLMSIFADVFKFIYKKNKMSTLRFLVKLRHAYYDYSFMTNLSMGIFASSIVALVVSTGIYTIVAYSLVAVVSFVAMIDYNYKR